MPSNASALLSGGVSVGLLAGVVSGLFYLVITGLRWAGEVRHFSSEWLNKQLQKHLGNPSVDDNRRHRNDDGQTMDSESVQVREFIERLVETLISGGLDQVNVNRLYTHPEYKPLEDRDSPSAAHADLKQLIHKVVREAMTLPTLNQCSQNISVNGKAIQDDINSKTYEEILATAILNKVIQRFQHYSVGPPMNAIDGNSNLVAVVEAKQGPKFISRVEIGMASSSSVDDDTSAVDDGSWSESSHTEPLSLTIEECVEEEMTTYNSEEDEDHGQETKGAELDFYLSGLNFIKKHRVPFPELGMDIVEGLESEDDDEEEGEDTTPLPTDLLSPVDSWEDNWLFQRRRLKTLGSREPVPMLVPNPSEDFRALIGDRDAEEISDLSDCSESVIEDILADDDDEDNVPAPKQELTKKASLEISLEVPRLIESKELPRVPNVEDSTTTYDLTSFDKHETDIVEARNGELTNGMDSLSEFGQQDSEYTEDYASVTRRQMNSLKRHQGIEINTKPIPKPRKLGSSCDSSVDGSFKKESTFESSSDFSLESTDSVNELATPPRPGTIAEREHKKWESAVPLPNNPYSPENIMKRLHRSTLLDIRTNCNQQLEKPGLSEISNDSTIEKNTIPCLQNDANITRYGRDYYINTLKTSSSMKNQTAQPVEIVTMSSLPHSRSEVTKKCKGAKESPGDPCLQSEESRVGSQVHQWQHEINQTEELWLKKINNCKNEPSTFIQDTQSQLKDKKTLEQNGFHNILAKQSLSEKQNSVALLKNENNTSQDTVNKISRNNVDSSHNSTNEQEILILNIPRNASEVPEKMANSNMKIKNAFNRKEMNGKTCEVMNGNEKKNTSVTSSEGSISDCELVPMPSVKDLAKHFTQTNQATAIKNTHPNERTRGRQAAEQLDFKKAANQTVDGSSQPLREVHSLTARSISREFREELKRNLPSRQDRNMHGSDSSLARSDSSLDQGQPAPYRGSDMETSTTPSYASDDSSGPSPTPGSLRNNIAFWEQMQRNK